MQPYDGAGRLVSHWTGPLNFMDSCRDAVPREADDPPEAYALASAFATAPPPLLPALAMACAQHCTAW